MVFSIDFYTAICLVLDFRLAAIIVGSQLVFAKYQVYAFSTRQQ